MGEIYRAHDEHLDRNVVLKIPHARTLRDQSARKRFRNEALTLAKLKHAHMGAVDDFGSETVSIPCHGADPGERLLRPISYRCRADLKQRVRSTDNRVHIQRSQSSHCLGSSTNIALTPVTRDR